MAKATRSATKGKARATTRAARPARKARKAPRRAPAKHAVKSARTLAAARGGDFTKYSGKFTVRLPKSLHQALVVRAEKEGVSLNLFVTNALSRTVAAPGKGRS